MTLWKAQVGAGVPAGPVALWEGPHAGAEGGGERKEQQ